MISIKVFIIYSYMYSPQRVPPEFIRQYEHLLPTNKDARLTVSNGKRWKVGVERMDDSGDYYFTDGWVNFALDNDFFFIRPWNNLKLYDCWLFMFLGVSNIKVISNNTNGCEKSGFGAKYLDADAIGQTIRECDFEKIYISITDQRLRLLKCPTPKVSTICLTTTMIKITISAERHLQLTTCTV
ncbi:hypothetical protein ABFS82_10G106200 [Erythranthe guttata]